MPYSIGPPIINDEWNKKRGTRSRLIITFCEQRVKYPRRHTFSKEEKNVNDPIKQILYHINIRTSLFIFLFFFTRLFHAARLCRNSFAFEWTARPSKFQPLGYTQSAANEKGKITFSGFLSRSDEWPQFPYRNWINRLKRGTARTARAIDAHSAQSHRPEPYFFFRTKWFLACHARSKKERKLARNFFFSWRGISVKKCLFGGAIFENYMPLNEGARARESPSFKSGGNAFSASPAR